MAAESRKNNQKNNKFLLYRAPFPGLASRRPGPRKKSLDNRDPHWPEAVFSWPQSTRGTNPNSFPNQILNRHHPGRFGYDRDRRGADPRGLVVGGSTCRRKESADSCASTSPDFGNGNESRRRDAFHGARLRRRFRKRQRESSTRLVYVDEFRERLTMAVDEHERRARPRRRPRKPRTTKSRRRSRARSRPRRPGGWSPVPPTILDTRYARLPTP